MHVHADDVGFWRQLRLSDDDLRAVSRTAYIIAQPRGRRLRYRLRFRIGHYLHSRSLGCNLATVDKTRAALERLRSETQQWRDLARRLRRGADLLKDMSTRLRPALEEAGFYFHGRLVRQARPVSKVSRKQEKHSTNSLRRQS
jgi:hypothetical protein